MRALMRSSLESKASTNRPRGDRKTHVTATGMTRGAMEVMSPNALCQRRSNRKCDLYLESFQKRECGRHRGGSPPETSEEQPERMTGRMTWV